MDFANRGGNSRHCINGEEDEDYNSNRRLSSFNLSSQTETVDDQPKSSGAGDPPFVSAAGIEKEHMFDKVVTPSDVGKLNRLVIPKQHAEKYFPLDSSTNEKGLHLNFQDRNGKPWRFRYSYWNSSQSYVMTKGWSRFVKEKRLNAGDTVSFGRGVGEAGRDRLFIDWKRKPDVHSQVLNIQSRQPAMQNNYTPMMSFASPITPWSRFSPISAYDHHYHHQNGGGYGYTTTINPYLYLKPSVVGPLHSHSLPRHGLQMQYGPVGGGSGYCGFDGGNSAGGGPSRSTIVYDSVPVEHYSMPTSANSKYVRLFGVNLDCSSSSSTIGDPRSPPAKAHLSQLLPPPLSLQLGLGNATTTTADMLDSPREDKQQPMSLDLDI